MRKTMILQFRCSDSTCPSHAGFPAGITGPAPLPAVGEPCPLCALETPPRDGKIEATKVLVCRDSTCEGPDDFAGLKAGDECTKCKHSPLAEEDPALLTASPASAPAPASASASAPASASASASAPDETDADMLAVTGKRMGRGTMAALGAGAAALVVLALILAFSGGKKSDSGSASAPPTDTPATTKPAEARPATSPTGPPEEFDVPARCIVNMNTNVATCINPERNISGVVAKWTSAAGDATLKAEITVTFKDGKATKKVVEVDRASGNLAALAAAK